MCWRAVRVRRHVALFSSVRFMVLRLVRAADETPGHQQRRVIKPTSMRRCGGDWACRKCRGYCNAMKREFATPMHTAKQSESLHYRMPSASLAGSLNIKFKSSSAANESPSSRAFESSSRELATLAGTRYGDFDKPTAAMESPGPQLSIRCLETLLGGLVVEG